MARTDNPPPACAGVALGLWLLQSGLKGAKLERNTTAGFGSVGTWNVKGRAPSRKSGMRTAKAGGELESFQYSESSLILVQTSLH